MLKEGLEGSELEVVLFGTLRRGGFQVYPADGSVGDSKPWQSQRSLERFYSANLSSDSSDKGGILQALRGPDRFELYFVRYGVLVEKGGRAGGCFGFAAFSQKGFPRDLPKLRTEVFESAVAQFVREGRLLVPDEQGRLCFAVDAFDTISPYLDDALEGLARHVASEIDESAWEQVPVGTLGEFPVVGGGTPASVTREILRECGGIEVSGRARDIAGWNNLNILPTKEDGNWPGQHAASSEPTQGASVILKDVMDKIDETRRLLSGIQTSLVRTLELMREQDIPKAAKATGRPSLPLSAVPRPISTRREERSVLSRSLHKNAVPLAMALILLLISLIATAIYLSRPRGGAEQPGEASGEPSNAESHASSAPGSGGPSNAESQASRKFLDVERFLAAMQAENRRVASIDQFLEDVGNFLSRDESIKSDFSSHDEFLQFVKNANVKQLARIDQHIKANMQRYSQFSGGVPYDTKKFWKKAIQADGEGGFRIHE